MADTSETDADTAESLNPPSDARELDAEYQQMLDLLDIAAEQCKYKIAGDGRIADASREQARSKWVNTLTKVVRERRQVIESKELVELAEQIEELKERQEHRL